jgi:hypothetical protein
MAALTGKNCNSGALFGTVGQSKAKAMSIIVVPSKAKAVFCNTMRMPSIVQQSKAKQSEVAVMLCKAKRRMAARGKGKA